MMEMMQAMMERLDQLEKQVPRPTPPPPTPIPTPVNRPNAIICHNWSGGTFCPWLCQPATKQPTGIKRYRGDGPEKLQLCHLWKDEWYPHQVLDTGAAVTLLHKDKWESLPPSRMPLKSWTGKPLVGVAGTPLEVWGTAFVDVEIAGEHFSTQVVVASALTTEAILGGDFLRNKQCTLEIGQRRLQFGGRGVAIAMDDVSSESVIVQARVTLDETIRIPAFSEKEVTARIDKPLR
jgi:hypothetical protein